MALFPLSYPWHLFPLSYFTPLWHPLAMALLLMVLPLILVSSPHSGTQNFPPSFPMAPSFPSYFPLRRTCLTVSPHPPSPLTRPPFFPLFPSTSVASSLAATVLHDLSNFPSFSSFPLTLLFPSLFPPDWHSPLPCPAAVTSSPQRMLKVKEGRRERERERVRGRSEGREEKST